jgi:hypothetical protein
VTSPDIGDNTITLLGDNTITLLGVQAESFKGSDQAHVSRTCWIIMMLLTRYLPSVVTILAQAFSGAIIVLKALNIFILWVLRRIISVRSTFPTSWKNSLAKYVRPNEESLCPSAEGTAVLFTRWLLKIWNLEREPWL